MHPPLPTGFLSQVAWSGQARVIPGQRSCLSQAAWPQQKQLCRVIEVRNRPVKKEPKVKKKSAHLRHRQTWVGSPGKGDVCGGGHLGV